MIDMTGTPAYRQVSDDLRKQIADGTLQIGDTIGSTSQLMAHYAVSSTVVRKAVEVLRDEGLLVGQPGKGVFVRRTPDEASAESVTLRDLARRVQALEAGDGPHPAADGLEEVQGLRHEVAVLRTYVIDLYARMGYPYPREDGSTEDVSKSEPGRGAEVSYTRKSASRSA